MRRYVYSKIIAIFLIGCFVYYVLNSYKLFFLSSSTGKSVFSGYQLQNTEAAKGKEVLVHVGVQREKVLNQGSESRVSPKTEKNTVILVWTTSSFIEEKGIEFRAAEKYGSCLVTMDRSMLNQSIAVVVFNNNAKIAAMDIPDPKTRSVFPIVIFLL